MFPLVVTLVSFVSPPAGRHPHTILLAHSFRFVLSYLASQRETVLLVLRLLDFIEAGLLVFI